DLLVSPSSGITNGELFPLPRMVIYRGHKGSRWGQNGIDRAIDWVYWAPQPDVYTAITCIDQDHDGIKDIVFARNDEAVTGGSLSILYGRQGSLPDTNDVQTISFAPSKGRYALFNDVTGDEIPDLLIGS